MDKKQLEQLRHLVKEIELLKKQIADAEAAIDTVSDTVTGSSRSFPYTQHIIRITGIDIQGHNRKIRRLKATLGRRLEKLISVREELEEYIASIPDSEIRQILTLRYVEGLSWQQIAMKLGTAGDGSTERKKHDRFLNFSRIS